MRISDWSSDVCSSDLFARTAEHFAQRGGFGFGGATSALAIFVDDRSSRRGTLDGGFDTRSGFTGSFTGFGRRGSVRSEEHTSELQSLMRNSYAVFCLKKKNKTHKNTRK